MRSPERRSMVATELHAGQVGAAFARPEQMIWLRPAAPKIPIEWLLRLIPEAEAKLYGVLTELIPSASMVAPNLACRQVKMAKLAKLAGLSPRWVIMLLPRLEERDPFAPRAGEARRNGSGCFPLVSPASGRHRPPSSRRKRRAQNLSRGKRKLPIQPPSQSAGARKR